MKTNWFLVTWSFAALAVFWWAKVLGPEPEVVLKQFGLSTSDPVYGLITYGFIHLRIGHLVTNLGLLFILGHVAQKRKRQGFVTLVAIAGLIAAGLGHLFLSKRPELYLHGSSGMVAALLGAAAARRSIGTSTYDAANLLKTLFWISAALLVVILTTGSQASLSAHLSGFFVGMILGSIRFTTARA